MAAQPTEACETQPDKLTSSTHTTSPVAGSDLDYPQLLLANQLCFPLYAASKEVVRRYAPLLAPHKLTYTQYLCLLALWEQDGCSVAALGKRLLLDSGTLTPVLTKLETRGLIAKTRDAQDARTIHLHLTPEGQELKKACANIPFELAQCVPLSAEEAQQLKTLLYKVLSA